MSKRPLWRLAVIVGLGIAVMMPVAANASGAPTAEDQNTVSPGVSFNVTTKIPRQFAAGGQAQISPDNVGGHWDVLSYASPVRSVHAIVMHTGKVLLSAGSGNDPSTFASGTFSAVVWDPASPDLQNGSFQQVGLPWDMFCSGHSALPDGTILVSGGTAAYRTARTAFKGSPKAYIFDPATGAFTAAHDMQVGRWYPTNVELGNGKVASVGGLDVNGRRNYLQEYYDPLTAGWTALPKRLFPNYPGLVLLDDGRLFFSGEATGANSTQPGIWDTSSNGYQVVPGLTNPKQRGEGVTLLLPPAQNQVVLTMGGGTPGIVDTNLVDFKSTPLQYVNGPNLAVAKMELSASILPDSTVLETGGGTNRSVPVYEASIYQPAAGPRGAFVPMNQPPTSISRTYHSESVLLPDGRVAVLGGNPSASKFEMKISIFSPPYMFNGPRPTIGAAPTEIHYSGTYDVAASPDGGSSLTSAVLVVPSAVTHSTDPNQRLVDLAATQSSDGLTIHVPSNSNLAPPGWYMMFVNDSLGRPSVASWVHLS